MIGPGASEIVLSLATVALADGASIFIASDTGAVTVSPTGRVVLVSPVIFSVVALDLEEPIEDGPTSDISSDMTFSFNERIAPGAGWRVTACGMNGAVPFGQNDRVFVLAPGSSVPVDPTADLAYGSEVSVIVDEGVFLDMDQTEFVKARCDQCASSPARQEETISAPGVRSQARRTNYEVLKV